MERSNGIFRLPCPQLKLLCVDITYKIDSLVLKETTKAKNLGVTINRTLSWNSPIDMVTKRANQTISFLHRKLSACPKDVKASSYKTLLCPQLEYAATVWDPPTKASINSTEAVQRRAARFCQNDYRHLNDSESGMRRSSVTP